MVYSLASVNVVITNPTMGQRIIGGGGKLVGSIKYTFTNEMYSKESTADGGVVVSHHAARDGDITIVLKQTCPLIPSLIDYCNWCVANPQGAESKMTVTDVTNNIVFEAEGVFPKKVPDNEAGDKAGDRSFDFIATKITAKV